MTPPRSRRTAGVALATATVCAGGCAGSTPLLSSAGASGTRESVLGWFLLGVSLAVIFVIGALVLMAAFRSGRDTGLEIGPPRDTRELRWITIGGIAVPLVILTVAFLFTIVTINAVGAPVRPIAATIDVTGHQWWWEITYRGAEPSDAFTTANEMHLPVGQPVRVQLSSGDVIHSFWVPALAGKVDVIPGQHNVLWLEATKPGVYGGPCAEYCGTQHAHMRMTVVAESPTDYQAWLDGQRRESIVPADSLATKGLVAFGRGACSTCHSIRGTSAAGGVGPDLTHFASRRTIAAGILPNTEGSLIGWITEPQRIKPGSDMPNMTLSSTDLMALVTYLETLK